MILTDDFLPKSVSAQNPLTLNKITETQRVLDQIIHNLDPVSIYSLMQGGSGDIDSLFNLLFDQTYGTLFGSTGVKDIGFNYIEKLNDTIEETYKIEDLAYFIATSLPDFNLKWYHLEWCKFILLTNKLCILASRDAGKCFSPDTKVRMGDGTVRKIVDIRIGDKVMGADGKPKTVVNRYVGIDDMYWIHQFGACSYKVNSRHTIHYKMDTGVVREMDVNNWLEQDEDKKQKCYGYRINYKTAKENARSKLLLEPAGKGVYVGITLAENPLFLLEDGTVVHNSYFFSNAYPIWKMYRYKPLLVGDTNPRKDLNLSKRGFIMTNELDLGVELLAILKDTIESSDVLKDKLYSGKSDSWSKTSITTKNACKLTVKSYGGSFRGRHPGYIVLDDYLRENVLYSAIQRDKSNNYFSATIMNALLKQGQGIIVGTPMHEQDIYGVLKKKKNWTVLEYPAIFPDGTILDPERYSYEDLMEIKEDQGSLIFTRERLVKPIMNNASIFNDKFMKKAIKGMEDYTLVRNRESFPKEFLYIVVGVDLAISASASADYSFYTVWGVDDNHHMWLIYVWRKKGAGYNEQLNALKTINDNFGADLFCIETNQFQAVIGKGAEELGLNVFEHHTGENKYNFKYGLPAVAAFFEKGKIHLPYGDEYSKFVSDLIISEFTSIIWTPKGLEGAGAHDDGAMSTWKAFAGLCELDKDFI